MTRSSLRIAAGGALLASALLACAPKDPRFKTSGPPVPDLPEADDAAAPPPPPPPPPPPVTQGIESEGMRFDWSVQGSDLQFTLIAPTTGWVRVGFNTVAAQHQADMIVAWVADGQIHAEDRFAVDPPYIEPDTMHGGTDNVTIIGGSEADGRTRVELKIPLASGEPTDLVMKQGGRYYLILSYADDDDLESPSVVRTAVPVTL